VSKFTTHTPDLNVIDQIVDLRDRYAEAAVEIRVLETKLRECEKKLAKVTTDLEWHENARRFKAFEINGYDLLDLLDWNARIDFRRNLSGKETVTITRQNGKKRVVAERPSEAMQLALKKFGTQRKRER